MAEENTVTMTVENVDRLFSEIVVNGESHVSDRYIPPEPVQNLPAVQEETTPSQNNSGSSSPATSPAQSIQGQDVYGVELNNILHNFVDRAVTQGLADEETARQLADSVLQSAIDAINALIPVSASSTNKLTDSASVNSEIENAINALDVAQAGGSGKFIQAVSETNGKISATEGTIDSSVSSGSDNPVSGGAVSTAIGAVQTSVQGIEDLIPSQATPSNQLADKDFVNSSISTNTANFIGTFESVTQLRAYSGTVTNNDYAFVRNTVVQYNGGDFPNVTTLNNYDKTTLTNGDYAWVVNSEDNTKYDLYRFDIVEQSWVLRNAKIDKSQDVLNSFFNRYKATVSGSTVTWAYEYTLNNSSFTASQWATINSGLTSTSVSDAINALDVAQTGGSGKFIQAISETDGKISATEGTIDSTPSSGSDNPVTSGGVYTAINTAETNAKNLANATGTLSASHGGTGQTSLDDVTVGVSKNTFALDKYVTCSTGASTSAKTVTLTGFTLVKGAKLIVYLQNANTAQSVLTLNVNNTGAKTIIWNGTITSSSTYAMTATYYNCYYDGTYWNMDSNYEAKSARTSENANYAVISVKGRARQTFTCSTGASTVAKTVSVSNYSLATRDEVLIYFSNTNTASNPTLNVSSTGAKPIKVFGTSPNSTNGLLKSGTYYCQYDGTNWNCYPYGVTNEVTADNMQSVSSNAVASALSMSSTEHIVGYWTDGTTPIYERTFVSSFTNNSSYINNIATDLPSSINRVVYLGGMINAIGAGSNQSFCMPIPFNDQNVTPDWYTYINYNSDVRKIYFACNLSTAIPLGATVQIIVSIRYTKS